MASNSSRTEHSAGCVCWRCSGERSVERSEEWEIQRWREQQWENGNWDVTNSSTPWDGDRR
jgi:hypothetical protein